MYACGWLASCPTLDMRDDALEIVVRRSNTAVIRSLFPKCENQC